MPKQNEMIIKIVEYCTDLKNIITSFKFSYFSLPVLIYYIRTVWKHENQRKSSEAILYLENDVAVTRCFANMEY